MFDQIDPKIVYIIQNYISYQKIIPPEAYTSSSASIDFFDTTTGKWKKITGEERVEIWNGENITDFRAEITLILQSGKYYTVEWTNTGRYFSNDFHKGDKNYDITIRCISIFKIEDYKVVEYKCMYDTWGIMKFVGRATLQSNDSKAIQKYMEMLKKAGFLEFDSEV